MSAPRKPGDRKPLKNMAALMTLLSMASTGILLLWYALGPKSGMEALALLFPWLLALGVHFFFTIPALVCAWRSRDSLVILCAAVYFLIFWSVHGWYYIKTTQLDIQLEQKVDAIRKPDETALADALKAMRFAAHSGSMDPARAERVKSLIRDGADVTYRPPGQYRPLITDAAAAGDPEIVRLMLENGALPEGSMSGTATTPLMEAVRGKHAAAAQILLEHGASPNHPRYNPETPLMVAVRNQDAEMVRILLKNGADPDREPKTSLPALQIAAGAGNAAIIKQLVDAGANPDRAFFTGTTAVTRAIAANCAPCIQHLIDAGARLTGKSRNGQGPLAEALQSGNTEIITILQRTLQSADRPETRVDVQTFNDMFRAIRKADWRTLEQLLAMGAPADLPNSSRETLLLTIAGRHYARPDLPTSSEVAAAALLARYNADLNARDKWGCTPLLRAAKSGARDLGQWLIRNGADISIADESGKTALLAALNKGDNDLAAALIDAGADPNAATRSGMNSQTALNAAIKNSDEATLQKLLAAGAVINTQQPDYRKTLPRLLQSRELLERLLDSGFDLNSKDRYGRYPLQIALQSAPEASIRRLIEAGADPYIDDRRVLQPFLYLAKEGKADLMAFCLERNDRIRNDELLKRDAMRLAMQNGRTNVVRLLLGLNKEKRYYQRMTSVDQILRNARPPAEDPGAILDIRKLFLDRIGAEPPQKRRAGSAILVVRPQRKQPKATDAPMTSEPGK